MRFFSEVIGLRPKIAPKAQKNNIKNQTLKLCALRAPIEGKELNAQVDAVIKKRGHNNPINDIPWEVMIIDGAHSFAQNNSNSATR